jgi:hypothetical protein
MFVMLRSPRRPKDALLSRAVATNAGECNSRFFPFPFVVLRVRVRMTRFV